MGTIRFELRKEKKDKENRAPIRIIYQLKSDRAFYSTGQKTYPENWDPKTQQAIYIKKGLLPEADVKKLNSKLSEFTREIEKIENVFEVNGITYETEMVMQALREKDAPVTKKGNSSKELYAFIDKYIEDNKRLVAKGSLSVYRSLKSHLQDFEQENKIKVGFDKIDYAFFQSFQNFLVGRIKFKTDKKTEKTDAVKDKEGKPVMLLNNITVAKILSTLKTFLNYATKQGIPVSTKYKPFMIERETDLEVIALTRDEFETLYNLDLSKRPAWDQVRDVFCFSCVTGLRFSDLKQLKREHIKPDHLVMTITKTRKPIKIPLNQYSEAILKKYSGSPYPLPIISNQKSNEHLAKICEYAGIDEETQIVRNHGAVRVEKTYPKYELIRMHAGRKSFASLSLESGMSAEHVMKLGGWKDYKSFKRYLSITDDAAKGAMEKAWGAIRPKLKAVK